MASRIHFLFKTFGRKFSPNGLPKPKPSLQIVNADTSLDANVGNLAESDNNDEGEAAPIYGRVARNARAEFVRAYYRCLPGFTNNILSSTTATINSPFAVHNPNAEDQGVLTHPNLSIPLGVGSAVHIAQ